MSGRLVRARCAVGLFAVVAVACGPGAGVTENELSSTPTTPALAQRILLPTGAVATAVYAGPEGGGVIALRDGRFLTLSPGGEVGSADRIPGEYFEPSDVPVRGFWSRGPNDVLATTPGGALIVQRGLVMRARLPMFLQGPRAYTRFGAEALWATESALFASDGGRWLRLEMDGGAALSDVQALVQFGAANGRREAWVHAGTSVRRVHYEPASGAMPGRVVWFDATPGLSVGSVRGIAALDDARGIVASERGVTVVAPQYVRLFRSMQLGAPDAVAGGGGWGWAIWGHRVLRTDGDRWETLVTDDALGPASRIAVNEATGSSALVIDSNGSVSRIEATETLWLSGLADGAFVRDTRVALEAMPLTTERLMDITFNVDGRMLAQRMAAPWGWGSEGARVRDLTMLGFGTHRVDVVARYDNRELRRTLRFDYVSPVGRAPSYAADIAPIYEARCARCHSNGIARNLATYMNLSAQAPIVRSAVRENRMPPDVLLDPAAVALISAWVDANSPP